MCNNTINTINNNAIATATTSYCSNNPGSRNDCFDFETPSFKRQRISCVSLFSHSVACVQKNKQPPLCLSVVLLGKVFNNITVTYCFVVSNSKASNFNLSFVMCNLIFCLVCELQEHRYTGCTDIKIQDFFQALDTKTT